jgi:hypothetical protein
MAGQPDRALPDLSDPGDSARGCRTVGDGAVACRASAVGAHDSHGGSGHGYRGLHEPDRRSGPRGCPGQPDRDHHRDHQPGAAGRVNGGDRRHWRGDRLRGGSHAAGRAGGFHTDPAPGPRGCAGSAGERCTDLQLRFHPHLHRPRRNLRGGHHRRGPAPARPPVR